MTPRALIAVVVVAAAALAAAAGCSYTFDRGAPELPLVGSAPPPSSLPRLNRAPVSRSGIVGGSDGAPWAALQEGTRWRLVRLVTPPAEEVVAGDVVLFTGIDFYTLTHATAGAAATLVVHRAGDAHDLVLAVADLPPAVVVAPSGRAFAWFADGAASYRLVARDGSSARALPLPAGLSAAMPGASGAAFFSAAGDYFFERAADGRLVARAVAGSGDADLGLRPGALAPGDGDSAWACAADGLFRLLPATATVERHDTRCDELVSAAAAADGGVVYRRDAAVWQAGPGASLHIADLPPGARVLGRDGAVVAWSSDPPGRYAGDAGDGWLGGWRFMERGLDVQFSAGGARLRWLEHAADEDGVGELMSAALADRVVHPLLRNARRSAELADGRLLVESNQAVIGVSSRIVIADEPRRQARLVLSGASYFTRIPDSDDILAGVVGEGYALPEHDVVRVTLPSR